MRIANSASEAIKAAEELGYPVVLKLHSETITHKTDIGGVKLNLANAEAVRTAFQEIESAVVAKASRADFLGVSVQPMVKVLFTLFLAVLLVLCSTNQTVPPNQAGQILAIIIS